VTGRDGFGKVLDFGAGTGELTSFFTGSRRYVFDKEMRSISDSEVIPITSIEELASNGPYDLVVLSHVLEHVPYPTQLLESLRKITHTEGVIYVEVPLEYCGTVIKRRAIPIGGHVNYFSRSSLLRCLRSAGFGSVRMIRREIAPYGECHGPVLKSIASATQDKRFSPRMLPWPVDLLIDTVLTVKSRMWPSRFVWRLACEQIGNHAWKNRWQKGS
jgi:SAM-dependent methyltransferase